MNLILKKINGQGVLESLLVLPLAIMSLFFILEISQLALMSLHFDKATYEYRICNDAIRLNPNHDCKRILNHQFENMKYGKTVHLQINNSKVSAVIKTLFLGNFKMEKKL